MQTQVITTKPISVKLDSGLRDRLKNLANVRQRPAHWLMREAISQYIEREEKREALRQATFAAWQEYQDTGLHLTGDEVDAWMAKLEAGEDVELPACHR